MSKLRLLIIFIILVSLLTNALPLVTAAPKQQFFGFNPWVLLMIMIPRIVTRRTTGAFVKLLTDSVLRQCYVL